MAKSSVKHQSFKLTPHNHPRERVILYVVVAVVVGLVVGYAIRDDVSKMFGLSIMGQ